MTDTTPHNTGPDVKGDIDAAMEGSRTAAANVAGGIKNEVTYENAAAVAGNVKTLAGNHGFTIANAKIATSNVAGNVKTLAHNHGLTVENAKATFAAQPQSHWRMLVPLFAASIITVLLMSFHLTSPVSPTWLGTLVPLVMLMGEPILRKAISVTAASPRLDAAHLGAGWLAWCLDAVVTALSGTTDLVAKPENACKVMNLKAGHARANNSFVLSRLLRDLEKAHEHKVGGLCVEILDAGKQIAPVNWRVNILAIGAMTAQIIIALLAFMVNGDMNVLLFFWASLLAMEAMANLLAWTATKYHARKNDNQSYALMRGNGYRHVFIIRNTHPEAWNLEDMAAGAHSYAYTSTPELLVICLAALTFGFLTVAATMMPAHSVIGILAILFIGTVANILVAALPRESWMHGVTLTHAETISTDRTIFGALERLEEKYPGAGQQLVGEFVPAGLNEKSKAQWAQMLERRQAKEHVAGTYDLPRGLTTEEKMKEMEKAIRGQ